MTTAQLNNLLIFVGVALLNMLVIASAAALAAGTMPGFREGEFLRPAASTAVALLAFLAPILSSWISANRPRLGSEGLAQQVNDLRAEGVSRSQMVVVSRDDAALPLPVAGRLTAEQLAQVANELERRMREQQAADPLISQPPRWLPEASPHG